MEVTFKQAQFLQRLLDKSGSSLIEDVPISYDCVFANATLMRIHGTRVSLIYLTVLTYISVSVLPHTLNSRGTHRSQFAKRMQAKQSMHLIRCRQNLCLRC